MIVIYSGHQPPTVTQIGLQAPAREEHGLLIDFSSSGLQRKDRFHFYNRDAGDHVLGRGPRENAIDEFSTGLVVIKLCQSAGVEKVSRQLALSALFDHNSRKRAMNGR